VICERLFINTCDYYLIRACKEHFDSMTRLLLAGTKRALTILCYMIVVAYFKIFPTRCERRKTCHSVSFFFPHDPQHANMSKMSHCMLGTSWLFPKRRKRRVTANENMEARCLEYARWEFVWSANRFGIRFSGSAVRYFSLLCYLGRIFVSLPLRE
jgi:hypothetical protein